MTAQQLWIGANIVNVLALGIIIKIFDLRRRRAALPLPDGTEIACSVVLQRELNATSAKIEIGFYGLLMALGVAMLLGGIFWHTFIVEAVPGIIPAGTIAFAAIYLGKATLRIWESRQREKIATIAASEALAIQRIIQEGGC